MLAFFYCRVHSLTMLQFVFQCSRILSRFPVILLIFGSSYLYAVAPSDYLLFSSEKGYIGHVKKALAQGADVNVQDYFKKTPLIYASSYGDIEIVKLLLKYGAAEGIDIRDREGKTAYTHAKLKGFTQIMNLLKQYGASEE